MDEPQLQCQMWLLLRHTAQYEIADGLQDLSKLQRIWNSLKAGMYNK